mgnify:CR=1 FL=1
MKSKSWLLVKSGSYSPAVTFALFTILPVLLIWVIMLNVIDCDGSIPSIFKIPVVGLYCP